MQYPFSPEQLEHFKNKLMEERKRILGELMDEIEFSKEGEITEMEGDLEEKGELIVEKAIASGISLYHLDILQDIEICLKKIEEGTYGICESCEKPIELERLEMKPYARYCATCRAKMDRFQK